MMMMMTMMMMMIRSRMHAAVPHQITKTQYGFRPRMSYLDGPRRIQDYAASKSSKLSPADPLDPTAERERERERERQTGRLGKGCR